MFRKGWTKIATSLLLGFAFANPAQAAKPAVDYFSAGTSSNKAFTLPSYKTASQGSFPANSNGGSQAVKWFEKVDEMRFTHKAGEADRVILSRPFNQESERVREWTAVAAKVAKRYRELAQMLKAMPVPGNLPGVKEYRDLTADWYGDAAAIYEDLIKPRPPAKTIEELDASLDDIKARSQSLAQQISNLKSMDMSLRRTYQVHQDRTEDSLSQYVRSK